MHTRVYNYIKSIKIKILFSFANNKHIYIKSRFTCKETAILHVTAICFPTISCLCKSYTLGLEVTQKCSTTVSAKYLRQCITKIYKIQKNIHCDWGFHPFSHECRRAANILCCHCQYYNNFIFLVSQSVNITECRAVFLTAEIKSFSVQFRIVCSNSTWSDRTHLFCRLWPDSTMPSSSSLVFMKSGEKKQQK